MAANTLTTTYSDIQKEVAIQIGWGRSYSDWSAANKVDFGLIAKEGYRQFLYPEPLPGENKSHNWSFLYPLGTLRISAGYSASTVTVDADGLATLASGSWTESSSWLTTAEFSYTSTIGYKNLLPILTFPSPTTVTLDISTVENANGVAAAAGTSYEIFRRYYELPDDYGGMVSDGFTYRREESDYLPDIKIIGEGDIRQMDRANAGGLYPSVACITPIAPVVGGTSATAQSTRWVVTFYPTSESTYNLEYRYYAIPPALDETTNIYHYGGAEHSSTIIAAVVDVAFQKIHSSYEKHDAFLARLRQSILHDRRNYTAGYLGQGSKSRGDMWDADALAEFRRDTPVANVTVPWS